MKVRGKYYTMCIDFVVVCVYFYYLVGGGGVVPVYLIIENERNYRDGPRNIEMDKNSLSQV